VPPGKISEQGKIAETGKKSEMVTTVCLSRATSCGPARRRCGATGLLIAVGRPLSGAALCEAVTISPMVFSSCRERRMPSMPMRKNVLSRIAAYSRKPAVPYLSFTPSGGG
jgi:hypothetical protein